MIWSFWWITKTFAVSRKILCSQWDSKENKPVCCFISHLSILFLKLVELECSWIKISLWLHTIIVYDKPPEIGINIDSRTLGLRAKVKRRWMCSKWIVFKQNHNMTSSFLSFLWPIKLMIELGILQPDGLQSIHVDYHWIICREREIRPFSSLIRLLVSYDVHKVIGPIN